MIIAILRVLLEVLESWNLVCKLVLVHQQTKILILGTYKKKWNPIKNTLIFHVKCCQDETIQARTFKKLSRRARLLTLQALTSQTIQLSKNIVARPFRYHKGERWKIYSLFITSLLYKSSCSNETAKPLCEIRFCRVRSLGLHETFCQCGPYVLVLATLNSLASLTNDSKF